MLKKQDTGLKRNTEDKFYTNPQVAKECVNIFRKHINVENTDLIIEPSAGNGSFIKYIKKIDCKNIFYDINPENAEIQKCDFLDIDIKHDDGNIHIIGNPPFGRQSSLAIKFIKKCCTFASSISFILPKSFKKQSMHDKFNMYYHLIYQMDIEKNSFTTGETVCDVPCVFQIWIRKDEKRISLKKQIPKYFEFVKKTDSHDISFRRVGVNAGKIDVDTESKSIQSHYFIKFINDRSVDENIELLKKICFDFDNTVGPRSISKNELTIEFNKYLIL